MGNSWLSGILRPAALTATFSVAAWYVWNWYSGVTVSPSDDEANSLATDTDTDVTDTLIDPSGEASPLETAPMSGLHIMKSALIKLGAATIGLKLFNCLRKCSGGSTAPKVSRQNLTVPAETEQPASAP